MNWDSVFSQGLGRLMNSAALGFLSIFIAAIGGIDPPTLSKHSTALASAIEKKSPGLFAFGFILLCLVLGECQSFIGKLVVQLISPKFQRHRIVLAVARHKDEVIAAEFRNFSVRHDFLCGLAGVGIVAPGMAVIRAIELSFSQFPIEQFIIGLIIGIFGMMVAYWETNEMLLIINARE